MKDFLDKLSSYNLFNYFLPGILFVVISKEITTYSFLQENILTGIFLYYFIGLVISRIGSLIIEPVLKYFSFLKFADYKNFVSASQKDPKIELLSENNNMYRTLSSLFVVLLGLKFYELIEYCWPILKNFNSYVLTIGLLILFLFSYRKQTNYITKRININ